MNQDPELNFTPDLTRTFEIPCQSLFSLIDYGNSFNACITMLETQTSGHYRVHFDKSIPRNFRTDRPDGPEPW